jgi:signal transduction histidine kinase
MESIGQLTGGIAHDFNNMLTIIMGNLDTLQRRLKSIDNSAILNRPIEAALQGARNAAKLTHRLLAFSRQQALEPVSLGLNTVVASLADMLARTVGEIVKVEVVAGAGLWPVFADLNQVENSLINLAINSRDAMIDGGKLTIETANAFLDEAYVAQFGDLKAGQYVMLSVSDTGTGIPRETLDRVFEPFFTTKDHGKGTGLGLAMVYGFVKQSQGHIRIYSELQQGTTVKIYFPRHIEAALAGHPRGTDVDNSEPVRPAKSWGDYFARRGRPRCQGVCNWCS